MTLEAVQPEEPLRVSEEPLGGRLGTDPEHFIVEEQPLYRPSGSGDHWYVKLEKRGLTTPELVGLVARAAGVRERDVGYAGLKDKHAVTRQWLSLPVQALAPERWELPDSVSLLEVSKHTNKLRTGHLTGNHFCVTLLDVPTGNVDRARVRLNELERCGLPNFFGEQRFGQRGQNLGQALEWLRRPPQKQRKARFYEKLYPSVLQAEVYNRYLNRRYGLGLERLLPGEVVRLSGSGSVFVVEDAPREQPRLECGDVVLTGPIFGPRAVAAAADAAALEDEAMAGLGLDAEQLQRLGRLARGTRRDLVIALADLKLEQVGDTSLVLSFSLPAGSYATQLVRELTGSAWLDARTR